MLLRVGMVQAGPQLLLHLVPHPTHVHGAEARVPGGQTEQSQVAGHLLPPAERGAVHHPPPRCTN